MAKRCEACGNALFRDAVADEKEFWICVNPKCGRHMVSVADDGEETEPSVRLKKEIAERETAL
jgi:hypothetical protein